MINVAVKIVHDHFGAISTAQRAAVRDVRHRTGLAIEADWKADVRVDTGNYRRSVHTASSDTQTVVSSNVDYAVYNEFGTTRMAARPSATKAGERQRRPYAERCKAALKATGGR